jgi:membrane protein CcdC involved in cytochrome C biogenesis
MTHLSPALTAVVSLVGLAGVLMWRVREGRTAVTAKKLLMPPIGMATGFCMFLVPAFRIPLAWGLASFVIGYLFLAWPLLATSGLHRDGNVIMMKRSGAFFAVVIVLAVIRYIARDYFDRFMTLEQTGALFYLLAFGMIVRWRIKLFGAYRALIAGATAQPVQPAKAAACD